MAESIQASDPHLCRLTTTITGTVGDSCTDGETAENTSHLNLSTSDNHIDLQKLVPACVLSRTFTISPSTETSSMVEDVCVVVPNTDDEGGSEASDEAKKQSLPPRGSVGVQRPQNSSLVRRWNLCLAELEYRIERGSLQRYGDNPRHHPALPFPDNENLIVDVSRGTESETNSCEDYSPESLESPPPPLVSETPTYLATWSPLTSPLSPCKGNPGNSKALSPPLKGFGAVRKSLVRHRGYREEDGGACLAQDRWWEASSFRLDHHDGGDTGTGTDSDSDGSQPGVGGGRRVSKISRDVYKAVNSLTRHLYARSQRKLPDGDESGSSADTNHPHVNENFLSSSTSSSSSSSSSFCEEVDNTQSHTEVREESTRLYPYESIVPETDLSADESHLHPTDPELFAARKDVLLNQSSGIKEGPSLRHDTVESLPATQYFSSPEEERAPNFSCSSITDVTERDFPALPPPIFRDVANPTASPVPLQKNEGKPSNPQREDEVLKRDMLYSSPCQSLPSFGSPQCTPKTSTPHHQTACPYSLENKAPRFSYIHTAEATHHGTPSRPPPSTSPASTPRSSKVRIPNPGFQRPENWRQSAWEAYRHTRRTPSSLGRPAYLDLSVASYNRAASPSSVSVLLSPMMGVCSRRRRGAAEVLCSTMVGELSSSSLSSLRPAAGSTRPRCRQHPQACSSPKVDAGRIRNTPILPVSLAVAQLHQDSPKSKPSPSPPPPLPPPALHLTTRSKNPRPGVAPCVKKGGNHLVQRLLGRLMRCKKTNSTTVNSTAGYVVELRDSLPGQSAENVQPSSPTTTTRVPPPIIIDDNDCDVTADAPVTSTPRTLAKQTNGNEGDTEFSNSTGLDWDTTSAICDQEMSGSHVNMMTPGRGRGRRGLRNSDLMMNVEQLWAEDRLSKMPVMEVATARCITDFLQQRLRSKTYEATANQCRKLVAMAQLCSVDAEVTRRGVRLSKKRKSRFPVGRDIVKIHVRFNGQ